MIRRVHYEVAGSSLAVETRDRWTAGAIAALFDGWYLTPAETPPGPAAPDLIAWSAAPKPPIPYGLETFAIAGGGTCHVDGMTSYLDIDRSIVTIGSAETGPIGLWIHGPLPLESRALTRVVTCGLLAALRQRRRFELCAGAVVDPGTGTGVLIAGAPASGTSTLTVSLATAGWPFLSDGKLLLGQDAGDVVAWPLRRRFAITPETLTASAFLQASGALEDAPLVDGKHVFTPHEVFEPGFRSCCTPSVILFPERTGAATSHASRLSPGDTMARLTAMSPWARYDRSSTAAHLAVLGALALQARAWSLRAGRDLLDPQTASDVVAECVHKAHGGSTPP